MKKFLLSVAVLGMFAFLNAQSTEANNNAKQTNKNPASKEHVCTAACKDGKHAYAHNEKGHICTDACKKKM